MPLENIHNHTETLVVEELRTALAGYSGGLDARVIEDIACIALNKLPAHYIRHTVDYASHLSDQQHQALERQVHDAVREAIAFVLSHPQND